MHSRKIASNSHVVASLYIGPRYGYRTRHFGWPLTRQYWLSAQGRALVHVPCFCAACTPCSILRPWQILKAFHSALNHLFPPPHSFLFCFCSQECWVWRSALGSPNKRTDEILWHFAVPPPLFFEWLPANFMANFHKMPRWNLLHLANESKQKWSSVIRCVQ